MPRVPNVNAALALLGQVDERSDAEQDLMLPGYHGPIPPVVLLALIRDLRQRVAALEAAQRNP